MKLKPRLKPYFNYKETLALINPFNKLGAIERLEKSFAAKFENKFGTFFAHGRTGIFALLKSWNLNAVEIICPAYTCVVVQHAIVLSGNIPVFVDASINDWNMDLGLLKKSIGPNTRVVIATHLFGYPMNVIELQEIIKEAESQYGHKIYVIQDVAHSYGAKWEGQTVTRFGDAAIFGMNISKILSSIFGGMVISNDPNLDKELKEWRNQNCKGNKWVKSIKRMAYYFAVRIAFNSWIYGIINMMERKGLLNAFVKYYEDNSISFPKDWNSPPTNTEASIGLVQLEKYDEIIKKRRAHALKWKDELSKKGTIEFMPDLPGNTYSHCVGLVENRNEWIANFRQNSIQLGILIEYSVPEMKAFEQFKKQEFPNAKYFSEHSINFPNWPR
ncbi:MAG: DegT/DnrJ/EryC1/StrS family aminotransferase [Bacteroidota bacterium]